METSCTYVASLEGLEHTVVFGSLLAAFVLYGVLLVLRDRRLATEGENAQPEASMANA